MSVRNVIIAPYACDIVEITALSGHIAAVTAVLDQDALAIAPARWWRRGPSGLAEAELRRLSGLLGSKAALIDQSSGFAGFRLQGLSVRHALARVCRLDLDEAAFPLGHAARSIIAQVPALVVRPQITDTFDIHVPITFGPAFKTHLERASDEFWRGVEPAHRPDMRTD